MRVWLWTSFSLLPSLVLYNLTVRHKRRINYNISLSSSGHHHGSVLRDEQVNRKQYQQRSWNVPILLQVTRHIFGLCFYFPLSESLKLNNQHMLKEKDFKCKRYVYLILVHLKILIKDNFLRVLITSYYIWVLLFPCYWWRIQC